MDERTRPRADGGEELSQAVVRHLEQALRASDAAEAKFHVRQALQQPAIQRRDIDDADM